MNLIDSVMTNPLQGFFTGITFLVLVNILVALLAGTVARLYNEVMTYTVLQRANYILSMEKEWDYKKRHSHIEYLRSKEFNPYFDNIIPRVNNAAKIDSLKDKISTQNNLLIELKTLFEKNVNKFSV